MLQFPREVYPQWHLSLGTWHSELQAAAIRHAIMHWVDATAWAMVQDERITKLQAIFGKPGTVGVVGTTRSTTFSTCDSYTRTLQFSMRDVDALPAGVRMALLGGTLPDPGPGTTGPASWGGWHYCRRADVHTNACATQCISCARNV